MLFFRLKHPLPLSNAKQKQAFARGGGVVLALIFTLFGLQTAFAAENNKNQSRALLTYEDRDKWHALADSQTETVDFDADTSLDIVVLPHQDPTAPLYFWIGDTAEPNDALSMALKSLNQHGQVWYMHTPEALFIESTRQNLRNEMGDWMPTIMTYLSQNFEQFYLVAGDVVTIPVTRGLNKWQQSDQISNSLKGLILLYPNFYTHAPVAGETPVEFPIVKHTALPIHILQPELGAQAISIQKTIQSLKQGGSLVQSTRIPEATDWYFFYEDIESMAPKTGHFVAEAAKQIQQKAQDIGYKIPRVYHQAVLDEPQQSKIISGLQKLKTPYQMPNIQLNDMHGNLVDIKKDYAGKALLVNFWATWCPHCVEEIPSMNNALKQLKNTPFEMVSISYKDTQKILDDFVKEVPVDFPILMDLDGQVSADWKVFAFPSSFLVNTKGEVIYTINSGSIWDTPEMVQVLESLTN